MQEKKAKAWGSVHGWSKKQHDQQIKQRITQKRENCGGGKFFWDDSLDCRKIFNKINYLLVLII